MLDSIGARIDSVGTTSINVLQCHNAKIRHGMTRAEYDVYLSKGCWVCGAEAILIDHDHDICNRGDHSCEKCRRGPACHRCNTTLEKGYTADQMRERIDWYQDKIDQLWVVVKALENK